MHSNFIMLIFAVSITNKPTKMNVIAIFGNTVEFSMDNEILYLSIDEFVEQYGEEALYGEGLKVQEYEEGKMYQF